MATTRAKAMRDKNQVVKLVKDLNKKMDSFEETVSELKILKESLVDMNDQIVQQEQSAAEQMRKIRDDLKDNKLKTITEVAVSLGKVVVNKDDQNEISAEILKLKEENARIRASVQAEVKEKLEEQLTRQLKIIQLQHECKMAETNALCENYKREVEILKDNITRMSSELDSQKKLTADMARGRNNESKNT